MSESTSALVALNAVKASRSPSTASRPWLARRCELSCRFDAEVLAPPSRAAFHVRSEEHTSELQSLMRISYAVFCLKKKTTVKPNNPFSISCPHHTKVER